MGLGMRSLVARIASLTVGVKIAAIMALLMLPIGHPTLLFVQQVRKDIAFSSLEIEGAHALKGLWEALATSTAGSLDTSNRKMAADRAAALRTAAANLRPAPPSRPSSGRSPIRRRAPRRGTPGRSRSRRSPTDPI